jgi:hypothetical protein
MDARFRTALADAKVQDIQLELIRRTRFDAFDGERIVASLLRHRELWEAVMLDRFCISRPGKLPAHGLIKLRDLADDIWNADTLYILAPNNDCASSLAHVAEVEGWGGLVQVHRDPHEVDAALGGADEEQAIVAIWWD